MLLFLAQEGGDAGSSLVSLLPLLLIGLFVYFAMIRPQRKRQQQAKEMQRSLSIGDDVITIGGLHGRVDAIGDDTVDLELTDDVVVRFRRSSVAEIVGDEPAPQDDDADDAETSESSDQQETAE